MARRRKVSPDIEVELETDEEEDIIEEALEQFVPTYERIEEYERQLEDLLNRIPEDVRPYVWITVIPEKAPVRIEEEEEEEEEEWEEEI